jgi:hypothetical protein
MNTLSSIFVTELAYDQDLLKQTVQGEIGGEDDNRNYTMADLPSIS